MNDPEIHSTTWEWDTRAPSEHWKHSHNFIHHTYTNIVGRTTTSATASCGSPATSTWQPRMIGNPIYNFAARHALRVGRRPARPRDHQVSARARSRWAEMRKDAQDHRQEGRQAGRQGLRRLPGADRARRGSDADRQRDGEPDPQLLVLRGHLLRPLPRRRREVHAGGIRERDASRVVPAADARLGQLQRRTGDGVHERQPLLPDRAPPVPRSAEQPVRGDQRAGARALRQVRPALHHRAAPAAVRQSFWTITNWRCPTGSSRAPPTTHRRPTRS